MAHAVCGTALDCCAAVVVVEAFAVVVFAGALLVTETEDDADVTDDTDDAAGVLSSPPPWVPTKTATARPARATSSAMIGLFERGAAISGTAP
ncbi:hypothetical protein P9209_11415 [Prescottella defluvii]|nr:hypothetical protein P9209_11415 [Prescottella defluvii]